MAVMKEISMEVWKLVEGSGGKLEVSNMGRVKSNMRDGRILKTQKDSKGYHRIRVTINRDKRGYKVHRLVAEAFIPNTNNLPQVNHIDGNKDNNAAENLEWVTNKDNAHHAIESGLWDNTFKATTNSNNKRKRRVIATHIESGLKLEFDSVSSAERYVGSRHIVDVIKGKRRQAKGFMFEYKDKGGDMNGYHNDTRA